jgi:hypothetical protein
MCENLSIIVTQFATKEQLKYLTHMFCLKISDYILYKKVCSLILSH